MRILLLKKLNEKMPAWMKLPLAGVIRHRLIRNREFQDTYQLLIQADGMSVEEKKKYQLSKLKTVLQHAYEHTVYYHQLFDEYHLDISTLECVEDIQRLPILTKEILKSRLDDLMADDINDFYMVTTGGSTGEPIKVHMERKAIYREWAFIYHYWSKFGYDFNSSKLATFRGVDMGTRISEINPLYSEIRLNPFIMNSQNIGLYNQKIDKYGADFIYGYPSAVYNYCRLSNMAELDVKGKYKAALLISENLYPFQEKLIREVLECPIVIFYGHSERAVFAEKYDAGYIFNPMYGITEIGSNSEPVVTGFINGKVPLIRYALDDQVEYANDNAYKVVGHHSSEVLIGFNGEQISAAMINFHSSETDKVLAYQFIQSDAGYADMNVQFNGQVSDKDIKQLEADVNAKLGAAVKITVNPCDKIVFSKRGKYKMIIQNLES